MPVACILHSNTIVSFDQGNYIHSGSGVIKTGNMFFSFFKKHAEKHVFFFFQKKTFLITARDLGRDQP